MFLQCLYICYFCVICGNCVYCDKNEAHKKYKCIYIYLFSSQTSRQQLVYLEVVFWHHSSVAFSVLS